MKFHEQLRKFITNKNPDLYGKDLELEHINFFGFICFVLGGFVFAIIFLAVSILPFT